MREIFFRGQDIHGNWYIGLLAHIGNAWYISNKAGVATAFEVIPSTIGQYTGLTDKNGTKIFEGDILKGMGGLHRVYFDTSLACFEWAKINGNWKESFSGFADEYEVIGNIHDNPELLERNDSNE